MDAATQQAHDALLENWRELRNGNNYFPVAQAVLDFAKDVGLLTDSQQELWRLRLEKCPGHGDEGGRDWCAYGCDMTRLRAEGLTS